MHDSVIDFLRRTILPAEIEGLEVLEVGSQDVNGSPRSVLGPHRPGRYIGVDFAPGPGVDRVLDVRDLVRTFGPEQFDVVVSTEMLEHAADWKIAVEQMKRVLRPFGLLVVTTRGPGFPYHGYPHDHWRFTVEDFKRIFADMEFAYLEPDVPEMPGVLMKAVKDPKRPEVVLDGVEVARAPCP